MTETSPCEIIVGVDTHKHTHAAVAINTLGARLGAMTIPVSTTGYRDLEAWARSFGPIRAFGIEGTGSYGAGLSRSLQANGHPVFEVNRPNRQLRHQHGKSDPVARQSKPLVQRQSGIHPMVEQRSVGKLVSSPKPPEAGAQRARLYTSLTAGHHNSRMQLTLEDAHSRH